MSTICRGVDALSGRHLAVSFGEAIESVEPQTGAGDGLFLAPGWIDLQVNGFLGIDFNTPEAPLEDVGRAIRRVFSTGTTRFLATVITGSPEQMLGALRNLTKAKRELPEGVAIAGFHVEGPHISPEDGPRGAHPKRWVRRPDIHELNQWQEAAEGWVKMVTVAPEWPEAPRYIEAAVKQGIAVSIGHTAATTAQLDDAVRAGATLCTHLGNGAHSVMPRHPNYIWDQLADDRLTAGFIVDGIHLPSAFLKVAVRAKGPERRMLITDATVPTGAAPGPYRFGALDIELKPGDRVVLAGTEKLAGSALQMQRGVGNLVRLAGLTLAEAVAMATVNPGRAANIPGADTGLATGQRGDLVEFRFDEKNTALEVERTYVAGKLVYERGSAL